MTSITIHGLKALATVVPATVTPRDFVNIVEWAQRQQVGKARASDAQPTAPAAPAPVRAISLPAPIAVEPTAPGPDPVQDAVVSPQPRAAETAPAAEAETAAAVSADQPIARVAPAGSPRQLGRGWSADELRELHALVDAGRTASAISKALGRSLKAVQMRCKRSGLKPGGAAPASISAAEPPASRQPTPGTDGPSRAKRDDAAPELPGCAPRIAAIVTALKQLDDNFAPADDVMLVTGRYNGLHWDAIADELGCSADDAKARWRLILGCRLAHKGGIITAAGWADLQQAARFVAGQV